MEELAGGITCARTAGRLGEEGRGPLGNLFVFPREGSKDKFISRAAGVPLPPFGQIVCLSEPIFPYVCERGEETEIATHALIVPSKQAKG